MYLAAVVNRGETKEMTKKQLLFITLALLASTFGLILFKVSEVAVLISSVLLFVSCLFYIINPINKKDYLKDSLNKFTSNITNFVYTSFGLLTVLLLFFIGLSAVGLVLFAFIKTTKFMWYF